MNRTITIDLSVKGLGQAIHQLDRLKQALKHGSSTLAREFAETVAHEAQISYETAVYDGANDTGVNCQHDGGNAFRVSANGSSVAFIEFGTGVHNRDWAGGSLPDGVAPHGAYGKGFGTRKAWVYPAGDPGTNGQYLSDVVPNGSPDKILTYGNDANDCLYNAAYIEGMNALTMLANGVMNDAIAGA